MNTVDLPSSAVRMAFAEAELDCITKRLRHVASGRCSRGIDCDVCAALEWAREVFVDWASTAYGADDLAAARNILWSAA